MQLVKVSPYNSSWPEMFKQEAHLIKQALGDNCIAIHHIGSTSIPGLSAKPILDILPVVKNILHVDKASESMQQLGYEVKGEHGIAFRRFFQKGTPSKTHNVHVYEEGDPEIDRYIRFRDWLRSNPNDALTYSNLKLDLAKKFPEDILNYCLGKDAFVAGIDTKNGFEGWRMVQALTDREWATVNALEKEFLKEPSLKTINEKDHIHFVFYKNATIIGYAHLELCSLNEAMLRFIAIDKLHQNLGFGTQFLKLCERWLRHQKFQSLALYAPEQAIRFFYNRGYTNVEFSDMPAPRDDPHSILIKKFIL